VWQSGSTFVINYGINSNGDSPTAADLLYHLKNGTDIDEYTPGAYQMFLETFDVALAAGESGTGNIAESWKTVTIGDALNGNGLQFFGGSGIAQKIEIVGSGNSSTFQIDLSGDTLTIQLATDADGKVLTTATDIVNLMNQSSTDTGGMSAVILRPEGQSYTDSLTADFNFGYGLAAATSAVSLLTMNDPGYKTVNAVDTGTTKIVFETVNDGSKQTIQIKDSTGQLLITDNGGNVTTIDSGADMVAKVNGYDTLANGRTLNFISDQLSFTAEIGQNVKKGDTVRFDIIGGGAVFQLGGDVRSDSQLHVGIPSVRTSFLGGASGVLEELREIDFDTDAGKQKAYKIVSEAVKQTASLRAFIGVLQKSTLDTNAVHLDTQLEKVTEAEAEISNTDMALESSRLSRAELLAQTAMESLLYSRYFAQYLVTSLLQT
jgi:flagellin-like hook-associated protein FlgL